MAGTCPYTIPREVPAYDYSTGGEYYAPPIPYGHYAKDYHAEAAKALAPAYLLTGCLKDLWNKTVGLFHCDNCCLGNGCGHDGGCGHDHGSDCGHERRDCGLGKRLRPLRGGRTLRPRLWDWAGVRQRSLRPRFLRQRALRRKLSEYWLGLMPQEELRSLPCLDGFRDRAGSTGRTGVPGTEQSGALRRTFVQDRRSSFSPGQPGKQDSLPALRRCWLRRLRRNGLG